MIFQFTQWREQQNGKLTQKCQQCVSSGSDPCFIGDRTATAGVQELAGTMSSERTQLRISLYLNRVANCRSLGLNSRDWRATHAGSQRTCSHLFSRRRSSSESMDERDVQPRPETTLHCDGKGEAPQILLPIPCARVLCSWRVPANQLCGSGVHARLPPTVLLLSALRVDAPRRTVFWLIGYLPLLRFSILSASRMQGCSEETNCCAKESKKRPSTRLIKVAVGVGSSDDEFWSSQRRTMHRRKCLPKSSLSARISVCLQRHPPTAMCEFQTFETTRMVCLEDGREVRISFVACRWRCGSECACL